MVDFPWRTVSFREGNFPLFFFLKGVDSQFHPSEVPPSDGLMGRLIFQDGQDGQEMFRYSDAWRAVG